MVLLLISLLGLGIGALILRDANRLALHVKVAEQLMANGKSEAEAMESSGCNFWDTPWYFRLCKTYPALYPNK